MNTPYYLLGLISDVRAYKSRSPALHKAALQAAGLSGDYVPLKLERDNLSQALNSLWRLGFQGLNVTVPYKESLLDQVADLSPEARGIGAINTLVRQKNGFVGHNTDAEGFRLAAASWNGFGRGRVLLVGYGGAARAVLTVLKQSGAVEIVIAGRSGDRAGELAREFGAQGLSSLPNGYECDWLINASAVSAPSEGRQLAEWAATLKISRGLMDLNYGRPRNFWAELAANLEIPFKDGLEMLAHQARASFKLWTGTAPEAEVFINALKKSEPF